MLNFNNIESITEYMNNELLKGKYRSQKNIAKDSKVFTNKEIENINKLLTLNINILELIIGEYTYKNNNNIQITNNVTAVTSLRLNKEIYTLIKQKAKNEGISLSEIMNNCMLEYLNK